ncbi:fibrobacter succinogenes major paralogous domain-containing protein [Crocinitomicaceae bacterium]|nr:fibrobacter succinogenes major paralogous domain-containing protein [Crocinitomicaceae bacterium]MDG2505721.1 fibrobacter succinogenes major paralogous domain-containing protein [Crocinitomicaceae bacterium]
MRKLALFLGAISLTMSILSQANTSLNEITSIVDEVKIGDQVWMVKNLDVDTFRNGDSIMHSKTEEEWDEADSNELPAWCYYKNDSKNGVNYGKLYNWHAVSDPRGLAPKGWHIPTDEEWTSLIFYLSDKESEEVDIYGNEVGIKLKNKKGWKRDKPKRGSSRNKDYKGTNESGFSALPGGSREDYLDYRGIGYHGSWWSISQSYWGLSFNSPILYSEDEYWGFFSVRCIRD